MSLGRSRRLGVKVRGRLHTPPPSSQVLCSNLASSSAFACSETPPSLGWGSHNRVGIRISWGALNSIDFWVPPEIYHSEYCLVGPGICLFDFCLFVCLARPQGLQDLSSPNRDWTWALAVKAQNPSHWAARKFLNSVLLKCLRWFCQVDRYRNSPATSVS